MATTIKLKNSVTTTNAPSSLAQGEVAINVTDKKVWVGNAATTPVQLLGTGSDGTFTNISVSGVASFADGTVSLPAITNIGDTNTGIFFPAADTIAFTEGGTEAMRIDSSGNVGIGTSSPSTFFAKLAVVGNTSITAGNNLLLWNSSNSTNAYLGNPTASDSVLAMYTSSTERMRIDSSGNLLVGTTTLDPTFSRVNGLQITPSGAIYARANNPWDLGRSVTSGVHISFYTDNGSARVGAGNISSNGSVTAYNVTSDYRLKQNIAPLQNSLSKVLQLKPCSYNYIEGNQYSEGFVAHELQAVVPECVTGEKDALDESGKPVFQGVDASFLIATLTSAIQELKSIVDAQAVRITALESK